MQPLPAAWLAATPPRRRWLERASRVKFLPSLKMKRQDDPKREKTRMQNFRGAALTTAVLLVCGSISLASAQSKKPDARTCHSDGCVYEYITSRTRENAGFIIIRTRTRYDCAPGAAGDDCRSAHPIGTSLYRIQCKNPGGYIEGVSPSRQRGNRFPGPNPSPAHVSEIEDQLWSGVCLGKAVGFQGELK